jgi:hypothetical protein
MMGLGQRVFCKHFSIDHKYVVLDNPELWIDDLYRDDDGHLHIRVAGPGKTAFTLGFADSYDAALAEDPPPCKSGRGKAYDGGWVWAAAEAAARFRYSEEFAEAFPGRDPKTFAVYRLELPNGWLADVSGEKASDGVHRLLNDAPIVGKETLDV